MTAEPPPYIYFWGKADGNTQKWHPLVYHMLDVAAVARAVLQANPIYRNEWQSQLGMTKDELLDFASFIITIHDLGKFAVDFQTKISHLSEYLRGINAPPTVCEAHPASAWLLWELIFEDFVTEYGVEKNNKHRLRRCLFPIVSASFGHHGVAVHKPESCTSRFNLLYDSETVRAAKVFVKELLLLFPNVGKLLRNYHRLIASTEQLRKFSFTVSGLTILADWTASNSDNFDYIFPMEMTGNDATLKNSPAVPVYFQTSLNRAEKLIKKNGLVFSKAKVHRDTWAGIFPELSGYTPTPLQTTIQDMPLPPSPALYIIEDLAGAGKTEAALLLTYRLLERQEAEGFYFGLPTMATSNGMYHRLKGVYNNLFETRTSLILAHGSSRIDANFTSTITEDISILKEMEHLIGHEKKLQLLEGAQVTSSAACTQWLADKSKKVFLAQAGVGSIDQAMLGVIYSRHNTLRLHGLSRKILIIDEIHAYDVYMQKILENLLTFQASQNKSVILLSATLPLKMKAQLKMAFRAGLSPPHDSLEEENISVAKAHTMSFPLISMFCSSGSRTVPVRTRLDSTRSIGVQFLNEEQEVLDYLCRTVRAGKCAVWIRNTVRDVQNGYDSLKALFSEENLMIFHSRYGMADRQSIEAKVLEVFGKHSGPEKRTGRLLVASQVVEQSLDLDFDEMVTDLCPIDLIIQRAGRLRRHNRDKLGNLIKKPDERGPANIHILSPDPFTEIKEDWYSSLFPGAAFVYEDPAILVKTALILARQGKIKLPEESRLLVESVYGDLAPPTPHALQKQSGRAYSRSSTKKATAAGNLFPLKSGFVRPTDGEPWSESQAPTRLTDDTRTYRLCTLTDGKIKPLASGQYAWSLSEIKYRDCNLEHSASVKQIIKKTNAQLFDEGRGGILLPLKVIGKAHQIINYQSHGWTDKGRFLYDAKFGLRLEG